MMLENKNALVYGAGGNPSEIRTFAKGGRQERRNRDQRAAGEETDHDGG